jgi:hypothetical protein
MRYRRVGGILTVTALIGVLTLTSSPGRVAGETLGPSLCAPASNTFSTTINNTYFPLPLGRQWVLTGHEQGEPIGLKVTVTNHTETLHFGGGTNVTTRVVEEAEWLDEDGDAIKDADEDFLEVSLNYFAQAQDDGTVCYFGEEVDIYEGGLIVSHEGSWRADDPGNAPGIFMPGNPQPSMTFQQEFAPGVAEDEATILGFNKIRTPYATFETALKVRDFNPLDGSRGTKYYVADLGIVRDGPLDLVECTNC